MAATMCRPNANAPGTFCKLLSRKSSFIQTLLCRHISTESLKMVNLKSDKLGERQTQTELKKQNNIKSNNVKSTASEYMHVYKKDRRIVNGKNNDGQHSKSFWEMIEMRLTEAKSHCALSTDRLKKLDAGILKNLAIYHITKKTVIVRSMNEEGQRWLTQQERFAGKLDLATSPHHVVSYLKQFRGLPVNEQLQEFNFILKQNRFHQVAYFMVYSEIRDLLMKSLPDLSVGIHGSAVTNLGCRGSDLDLVVTSNKRKIFDHIMTQLHEVDSFKIGFCFPNARVPIINVHHCSSKISCDISIREFLPRSKNNPMVNSEVLYTMSILDYRFCCLVRIIKYWASCRGLCQSGSNPSPHGITWTLLTLFYFQQKGILPAARKLYHQSLTPGKKTTLPSKDDDLCRPLNMPEMRSINDISKDLINNHETLVELLNGFCDYYMAFDFRNRRISVYDGFHYQRHLRGLGGAMEIPLEFKECYNRNVANNVTSEVLNMMRIELKILRKALNSNKLHSVLLETVTYK